MESALHVFLYRSVLVHELSDTSVQGKVVPLPEFTLLMAAWSCSTTYSVRVIQMTGDRTNRHARGWSGLPALRTRGATRVLGRPGDGCKRCSTKTSWEIVAIMMSESLTGRRSRWRSGLLALGSRKQPEAFIGLPGHRGCLPGARASPRIHFRAIADSLADSFASSGALSVTGSTTRPASRARASTGDVVSARLAGGLPAHGGTLTVLRP